MWSESFSSPSSPSLSFSPPSKELYAFFTLLFLLLSLHSSSFPLSACFSAFYLFQSTQRFQHLYLQEKKEGRGRKGWALNEMKYGKILREKNNKSGIMAATREGEERQRICQQCYENCCVFHCLYHANQFLHFFSQAQTMRGDSTVRISLRSQRVWQCFGSATNLTALITNTVTLPSNWEIHFVSSHKMCCIDSASGRHSFFYSTCSLLPKWQAQIARQNTGVSLSTAVACCGKTKLKITKKNKNRPRVEFWNNAEETEWIKKIPSA